MIMSSHQIKSNKKQWTTDEDVQLLELVKDYGTNGNWPAIASHMESRSGKQCRERYMNQLDPTIKKSPWTHEEDVIIKRMHFEVGKKWSKFMDYLPGRSDNAIKNRYHIISRSGYQEHNAEVSKRGSAVAGAVPLPAPIERAKPQFVPETAAVRLDRFRSARDILNKKINALLVEQELMCSSFLSDEKAIPQPVRESMQILLSDKAGEPTTAITADSALDFAFAAHHPAGPRKIAQAWSPHSQPSCSSHTSVSSSSHAVNSSLSNENEHNNESTATRNAAAEAEAQADADFFSDFNFDDYVLDGGKEGGPYAQNAYTMGMPVKRLASVSTLSEDCSGITSFEGGSSSENTIAAKSRPC